MHALMELHEMDFNFDMNRPERVEKISRILMLIDGKLVDDLSPADDRIRAWVARLAEPHTMGAHLEEYLDAARDVASAATHDDDRNAALFAESILNQDYDQSTARDAADVLTAGYLDNEPELNY